MSNELSTTEANYLVAFDPEVGYCRLFRTDSEEGAGLAPLWTGLGLRAGYQAMIRLNDERRPVKLYVVVGRLDVKGKRVFRIIRSGSEDESWDVLSTHTSHADARTAKAALVKEEETRLRRALERAGLPRADLNRLTAADRRYIEWLESTGRVAA